MNIAIVDNSLDDRLQLTNDIKNIAKNYSILIRLTEFASGEEFLERGQLSALDAIFLDIYMNGLNGMNLAYKIREKNPVCEIIFVTQSRAYAVQSYDVRAFHYILKPYSFENIAKVIGLLDQSLRKSSRFIKVKAGREWCDVLLGDILYVDYYNHYVQIHTEAGIVSTYMKFQEIQEKLLVYGEFLNCYRCIVVNMNKIKKVEALFFILCNGEYLPINRKKAKEIKQQYISYIFEILETGNRNIENDMDNNDIIQGKEV